MRITHIVPSFPSLSDPDPAAPSHPLLSAASPLSVPPPRPPSPATPTAEESAEAFRAWVRSVYRTQRRLIRSLSKDGSRPKPGKPGWAPKTLAELLRPKQDVYKSNSKYWFVKKATVYRQHASGWLAELPKTGRRGVRKLGWFADEDDAGMAVVVALMEEAGETIP